MRRRMHAGGFVLLLLFARGSIAMPQFVVLEEPTDVDVSNDHPLRQAATNILTDPNLARKMVNQLGEERLRQMYGSDFGEFERKYRSGGSRSYYRNEQERQHRFGIFCENMIKIEALRTLELGTATYGVTKFSDISGEEFKRKYLTLKTGGQRHDKEVGVVAAAANEPLPEEFDWRDHDAVTAVKDQGDCGSCYAFSVAGNIEGQLAIQEGKLIQLSEQEIIDCDELDNGCDGGDMPLTYEAIREMGGLEKEEDYPYVGEVQKCKLKESRIEARLRGSVNISRDENKIAQSLLHIGPLSVAMNADWLPYYTGGVSYLPSFICEPSSINHALLLVGYGTQKTFLTFMNFSYWLIKNSWGEDWGEEGYYRIYRGAGVCGINLEVTSAQISAPAKANDSHTRNYRNHPV